MTLHSKSHWHPIRQRLTDTARRWLDHWTPPPEPHPYPLLHDGPEHPLRQRLWREFREQIGQQNFTGGRSSR